MDVNDNAPEFASEYEAFLCENGKPGQVSDPWPPCGLFLSLLSFSLMIGCGELRACLSGRRGPGPGPLLLPSPDGLWGK